MSAIVKQSVPAPQAKKVSAADLLAGAAKKGKSSKHLVYPGEAGREAAVHWLDLNKPAPHRLTSHLGSALRSCRAAASVTFV